jgi:hypothetical protein
MGAYVVWAHADSNDGILTHKKRRSRHPQRLAHNIIPRTTMVLLLRPSITTALLLLILLSSSSSLIAAQEQPQQTPEPSTTLRRRHLQSSVTTTTLRLIDVKTKTVLADLSNGARIDVTGRGPFNIQAVVSSTIGSVVFGYQSNPTPFRIESTAPYAFCGDTSGTYTACSQFDAMNVPHTVSATPYSLAGGKGVIIGPTRTVTFTLTRSGTPTVVPPPTMPAPVTPVARPPTRAPVVAVPSPSSPVAAPVVAPPTACKVPKVSFWRVWARPLCGIYIYIVLFMVFVFSSPLHQRQ